MNIPRQVRWLGIVATFGSYYSRKIGNAQCFAALGTPAVLIPNMVGKVRRCSHRRRGVLVAGTGRRIHKQAVLGHSIAGAGKPADQDHVVVAAAAAVGVAGVEDNGMWYSQVADDKIVVAAACAEARADNAALECQTSTQTPGAGPPFDGEYVFRLAEKAAGHAAGRNNHFGIPVVVV